MVGFVEVSLLLLLPEVQLVKALECLVFLLSGKLRSLLRHRNLNCILHPLA